MESISNSPKEANMASKSSKSSTTTTNRSQILDDIRSFMERFVIFSNEDHAHLLSLWILHTWSFDAAYATPYLYVHSAEPQSGKTRVLEVCELLARNSITNSNTSTAAMFRVIEDSQPTLFLDEVDTVFTGSANEELRGVLNSGYKAGGSVMRFDGKDVVRFATFCPKMLVGIDNGQMPETLKDRCIPISLKRKRTDQVVERFVPRRIEAEAATLKANVAEWAQKNDERIRNVTDAKPIEGISDRSFEICEPLLALAAVLGTTTRTRQAVTNLMTGKVPQLSLGVRCLAQAKETMDELSTDRIPSAQLAQLMNLSPKKLGIELAKFEIKPTTIKFRNGDVAKGYHRREFEDAWGRYLSEVTV